MDIGQLTLLFREFSGKEPDVISPLPPSGSHRKYFRLTSGVFSAIGVYNDDLNENKAFLTFTRHFLSKKLHVPELYGVSADEHYYLLQDLGDTMLKTLIDNQSDAFEFPPTMIPWYKKALRELARFQVEGHRGLDYSACSPRDRFDRQSVLWDLNHFKYFFLKISGIPFDEQKLEHDFHAFASLLEEADPGFFLYRDFQSRNIMIHENECYFIDYQGGRRGALQYDPASLLFEARTNIPFETREQLLEYYLDEVTALTNTDRRQFMALFYPFALVRVLQAMGTYGLRGWVEKKPLFLQSVPFAINNLKWLLGDNRIPTSFPALRQVLTDITRTEKLLVNIPVRKDKLTVRIISFSYRNPIPDDLSGNGGGFVFDCRGIHNPGRYDEYKMLTGRDEAVQNFFREKSDMDQFLADVFSMTDRTISTYVERNYHHLQVCFGCTGGRHRSVFAAERLAERLKQNPNVIVELEHREMDMKA
ncbi:MAG TPA: RNase adapter RapZ [Bacteroidales bacterium]|nr:RNase adapter RapZ [Bacteroidales bacterium]